MTDPPVYRHLEGLATALGEETFNGSRWERNPFRWRWVSYTSPSGKYVVKWRGPRVRTIYRPIP